MMDNLFKQNYYYSDLTNSGHVVYTFRKQQFKVPPLNYRFAVVFTVPCHCFFLPRWHNLRDTVMIFYIYFKLPLHNKSPNLKTIHP